MTGMRLSGNLGICLMKWLVREGRPFYNINSRIEWLKLFWCREKEQLMVKYV